MSRSRSRPAQPPRDPLQHAPVFVLAPARSYTSVIATMVGQHPQLAGLPELKLFRYGTIGELERSLPPYWIARGFTHRSPGLVRAIAQLEFGAQTLDNLAAARMWLRERRRWSGAGVLDTLLTRLHPRIAVEKSPENVASEAALQRLAAAYPNARYLHLTRHPATTQASMAAHWLRTVPEHPRLGEPVAGIRAWRRVHARILRFTARLPETGVMRVRAEDILNDPMVGLRKIAEWLGVRADDEAIEAMRHPEASPFARLGPQRSGVVGGHGHDFLRNPSPRRAEIPGDLRPPPGWYGCQRLWRRTAELAREFGYGGETEPVGWKAPKIDPCAVRAELLRRRDVDQAARAAYTPSAANMARLMELDSDNAAWLKMVVNQVGWPGHSVAGEDGAHAAWLLAQHADLQPAFQRRCLDLLRQAVDRGDATAPDLAHLTDRVLLASGAPQLYGTQLRVQDGQLAPVRLREAETVDARRAAAGLGPLAGSIGDPDVMNLPGARHSPCPACQTPVVVWLPESGAVSRFTCTGCGATGTVQARRRFMVPIE